MTEKNKAIILMLLSSFSFTLMQSIVKLSSGSIGTMQQVFFRNLVSFFIAFAILKIKKLPIMPPKKYALPLLARSFFGFLAVVTLFIAVSNARQADVTLLNRTSPIWVTICAAIILKEKISKIQIPVIVLCLAGAFVAMQPSFDSNIMPLFLALVTAIFSGIAYTMIAHCKGHVNPFAVIFHFCLFSTVASSLLMIPSFIMPSFKDLILLCLIGVFGALGQITLTFAYQKAPAAQISIYNYSGIVFAAILGYVFFDESIAWSTVIGSVLIVGASLLAYFYNQRQDKKNLPVSG